MVLYETEEEIKEKAKKTERLDPREPYKFNCFAFKPRKTKGGGMAFKCDALSARDCTCCRFYRVKSGFKVTIDPEYKLKHEGN